VIGLPVRVSYICTVLMEVFYIRKNALDEENPSFEFSIFNIELLFFDKS